MLADQRIASHNLDAVVASFAHMMVWLKNSRYYIQKLPSDIYSKTQSAASRK